MVRVVTRDANEKRILVLRRPQDDLVSSYLEFIDEMKQAGEKIWEGMIPQPDESAHDFVQRKLIADISPDPELVAQATYWACLEDLTVVGRIALRHGLNDNLREFGGHIGYEVRPSYRRRGFATEMLRQLLQTPKAQEIGKLLVTCSPNNLASNKTIISNGGVLYKTGFVDKWQRDTNYYWIDLVKRNAG